MRVVAAVGPFHVFCECVGSVCIKQEVRNKCVDLPVRLGVLLRELTRVFAHGVQRETRNGSGRRECEEKVAFKMGGGGGGGGVTFCLDIDREHGHYQRQP